MMNPFESVCDQKRQCDQILGDDIEKGCLIHITLCIILIVKYYTECVGLR